jgi:hypothetical protein
MFGKFFIIQTFEYGLFFTHIEELKKLFILNPVKMDQVIFLNHLKSYELI